MTSFLEKLKLVEINMYTNIPYAVIFKVFRNDYFRCNIHIYFLCLPTTLIVCTRFYYGCPRSVFLSGNKKKISKWKGRLLVNSVPMQQRTTKIALNNAFDILKGVL